MRFSSTAAAVALTLATTVSATNYLGFNSGSMKDDRTAKFKADFVAEFNAAKNLVNAPGTFNAVRLYTNIQAYSESDPIQAFEAAMDTKTFMLLGIWASGTTSISNEINVLKGVVQKYGTKFTDLVIGISVGSEDLYRDSVSGMRNKAGIGAGPQTILKFLSDFRTSFANTPLAGKPLGHVDTWDAWPNATNKAVIDAVDFIGVNEFPYYEDTKNNNIKNAGVLFDSAYNSVLAVAGDKPVWVTETGWPYVGEVWGAAEATIDNAKYYWNEVGCRKLFGKTTAFWYNLRDSNPDNEMKFAITNNLSTKARFDLTCPTTFDTPSAASTSAGTATATGSNSASTVTTSTRGSAQASGSSSTTASAAGASSSTSGASSPPFVSSFVYGVVALAGGLVYLM